MAELGYDGKEMFKKGRFRPATFWKTSHCELVAPAVHKDRTLLTSFRLLHSTDKDRQARIFYILNCHLQAGKQAQRRLRQVNEGVRAVLTLARKLKEKEPETRVPLIVCGDFNGGPECGAVRYLEDGFIDETFSEDGDPVTSSRKSLPFAQPFTDVMSTVDRPVPPTMVVSELISTMIKGQAFDKPELSEAVVERLTRLYDTFATLEPPGSTRRVMSLEDVERWLIAINGQLGRGSEFREAARQMGWKDSNGNAIFSETKERIKLPKGGLLSLEGFIQVYQAELNVGKFWGIANDLAVLGEPMPNAGLFQSRYDRMYCSAAVEPVAVMDFTCSIPCPNEMEPSDHLPVAASFILKNN
jgi:endonuclease/exonuclease/phosphatase family metal-dependent hydrolase